MATLESLGLTNASTLTGLALGVVASYAVGGPAKGSFTRAVVFGAIGAVAGRMLLPQRPLSPQEKLALAEREEEKARQQAIINRQEATRRRTEAAKKAAMAPAVAVQRARTTVQLQQVRKQFAPIEATRQAAIRAQEQRDLDKAQANRASTAQYAQYVADRRTEEEEAKAERAARQRLATATTATASRTKLAQSEASTSTTEARARLTPIGPLQPPTTPAFDDAAFSRRIAKLEELADREDEEDEVEAEEETARAREAALEDLIAEGDEDDEVDTRAARARADSLDPLATTAGFQYIGQIYF